MTALWDGRAAGHKPTDPACTFHRPRVAGVRAAGRRRGVVCPVCCGCSWCSGARWRLLRDVVLGVVLGVVVALVLAGIVR